MDNNQGVGVLSSFNPYVHNTLAVVLNLIANGSTLLIIDNCWFLSGIVRRKLIHLAMGLVFMLCWNFYSFNASSRYFASFVPFLFTLYFTLVGFGLVKDEKLVQSMTRKGDCREILKGPLIYGIIMVIVTILFWRELPHGIITLSILCAGDGLADIFGRHFGHSTRYSFNDKSLVGSLAMFIGATFCTVCYLSLFENSFVDNNGKQQFVTLSNIYTVVLINLVCTIIEVIHIPNTIFAEDNLTISLTALILSVLLL
ncbi:hypothetical protein ABK040_008240 [Willaertia magna]